MVSGVKMTKSFFKIPMQAIYPRNWEKMMTIPTQGDDVPSDTRALLDVSRLFNSVCHSIRLNSLDEYSVDSLRRALVLVELIGSNGSLFSRFNIHLNCSVIHRGKRYSIDSFFDLLYGQLLTEVSNTSASFTDDFGQVFELRRSVDSVSSSTQHYVNDRRFIELFRDFSFSIQDSSSYWALVFQRLDESLIFADLEFSIAYDSSPLTGQPSNSRFLNIEPIIAYQLACVQFGTNDFVDFIYSAQLFRDNMQSIAQSVMEIPYFEYNGVRFLYDVFSEHVFNNLINYLDSYSLDFFINLFSYQYSLRFGDYFTGAKPRPLAVGEYSAQVNNNEVSAIDITRSIQMQRLLNRVNLVGRKLGDYLSGIFGGPIPQAPKDVPIFLAHQKYDLKGFEVNNTGSDQFAVDKPNTITSQIRSAENRHIFEIQIDEPCYIIGVNSYETPRIYSATIDRFAFHHDRYDDFIPLMQYIGDQDINVSEINSSVKSSVPFAYTLRYMEYKQRYSYASGGFIENLRSWAFVTDNQDGNTPSDVIDPNYIRSSPSEFDRFYKSLTGYSLGSYFHFIVAHTNVTSPSRMMEYTPEILK